MVGAYAVGAGARLGAGAGAGVWEGCWYVVVVYMPSGPVVCVKYCG